MSAGATARRRPARRRFPRITTRVLVDYVARGRLRRDYATTLGAGGLFVATPEPLRSGETTRVRFRVPQTERLVEVDARVVWSHGEHDAGSGSNGMGLTFTDAAITAELARELERVFGAREDEA